MGANPEQIATIKQACEPLVSPGIRTFSCHDKETDLQWHAEAPGVIGLSRVVVGLSSAGETVFTRNVTSTFAAERTHAAIRRVHEETARGLAEYYGLSDDPAARVSHYASARELRAAGAEHVTRSYDIPAKHVPVYLYAADMLTRNSTILEDGRPAREFRVYINEDADPDFGKGDTITVFHQGAGQRSLSHDSWRQFNRIRDGAIVAFNYRYDEGYPVDAAYTRAYDAIEQAIQYPDFAEDAPLLPFESFAPAIGWRGPHDGSGL